MTRRTRALALALLALTLPVMPAAAADEPTVQPSSVRLDRQALLFGDGALVSGTVTCPTRGVVPGMEILVQQQVRGETVEGFISLSGGNVSFDNGSEVCTVGTHRFEMALENHTEFAFRPGLASVVLCEVGGVGCDSAQRLRLTRERTVTRSTVAGIARSQIRAVR